MSSMQTSIEAVRKSIVVNCSPERAFEVFTREVGSWWPLNEYSIGGDEISEVVSRITWTASAPDTAIKPGQFLEFPLSLGPLPDTDKIIFKALQTYSDGSVVRWIDEPPAAGGTEPEHPAPALALSKTAADKSSDSTVTVAPVAAKSTSDGTARTFGITGAILGLLGLILGALALIRSRRPAATPPA